LHAQTAQVTGRIASNDSDSAVAGASVAVKGTKTGTIANDNGNFTITAASGATLVISAIGYTTQEIPVNDQTNIPGRYKLI